MTTIRITLSGPSGNSFRILKIAEELGQQMGMEDEEIKLIQAEMKGIVWVALGGNQTGYDHLLEVFKKHFPFVELYSTIKLPINPDLYTYDPTPAIREL